MLPSRGSSQLRAGFFTTCATWDTPIHTQKELKDLNYYNNSLGEE